MGSDEVILLDTHVAVWFANDTDDLGKQSNLILDEALAGGTLAISAVSTWEIALLSVELNNLHPDPADRFIAATAVIHDATLVTADKALLRWRNPLKRQDASK